MNLKLIGMMMHKIIAKINGLDPLLQVLSLILMERDIKLLKAEIGNGIGKSGEVISNNLEIACGKQKIYKNFRNSKRRKKVQKIEFFMLGSQIRKGSLISNV